MSLTPAQILHCLYNIGGSSIDVPIIIGSTTIGSELSIQSFPIGTTYQWKRDGVNISGATNSTYELVAPDFNTEITVTVTFSSTSQTSEPVIPTFPESLFNDILSQAGNTQSAKIRVGFDGPGQELWSNSNSYTKNKFVQYPNVQSPLYYRANANISAGEGAPGVLSKWEPMLTLQMLQPDGLNPGKYFMYTLGFRTGSGFGDKFARWQTLQYGSLTTSSYISASINWTYRNLGSSTTSTAIPTSHPTQRTQVITSPGSFTVGQKITAYSTSSQYVRATVVSFDSGSGTLIWESSSNQGTGTLSSWTIYDGWKGFNISIVAGTTAAYSGRTDGETVDFEFTGTGFRLTHFKGSDGKIWTFSYLSGPDLSSPPANVDVDTYNATNLTFQSAIVFENLTYGNHRIRGTVNGKNPSSTATATTGNAWVYGSASDTSGQCKQINNFDLMTADYQITSASSDANEFAWFFKLTGSAQSENWLPSHSGNGVMTVSKSLIIDGVTVNLDSIDPLVNPYMFKFKDFTIARLEQSGNVYRTTNFDSETDPYFSYAGFHEFTKCGLEYNFLLTAIKTEGVTVSTGYNSMIQVRRAWFERIKTQSLEYINDPAVSGSTNLTSTQKDNVSYIMLPTVGSSPQQDHALAILAVDPTTQWRIGQPNLGTWFLQGSDSSNSKFYPHVMSGKNFTNGENLRVHSRLYVGNKGSIS